MYYLLENRYRAWTKTNKINFKCKRERMEGKGGNALNLASLCCMIGGKGIIGLC